MTVNSAYNPELLHNYRGMNCAHARLITLMTLLLFKFPQLLFLFCLLFFDALSHHLHVFLFLFVSVDFEVEMASHDETAAPDQTAG